MSALQTTVEVPQTTYLGEVVTALLTVRDMKGSYVLLEAVPFTVHLVDEVNVTDETVIGKGLAAPNTEIDTCNIVVRSFYQADIPASVFGSPDVLPARFQIRFAVPYDGEQVMAQQRFSVNNPNASPKI